MHNEIRLIQIANGWLIIIPQILPAFDGFPVKEFGKAIKEAASGILGDDELETLIQQNEPEQQIVIPKIPVSTDTHFFKSLKEVFDFLNSQL